MKTLTETQVFPSAEQHAPSNPEEVAVAVREARSKGLRLAVVSTGHGLMPLGDLSDSMLLDVSGLDSIDIDTERNVARVGGGVKWKDLLGAAAPLGLTAPFGTAGGVGVAGYSLGGGVGPMGRHLGLGASAIGAVELVTPEGDLVRADRNNDPELLWALKGGGGGLGVVTCLEIDLTPLPQMTGGVMIWPMVRAAEVASAWARWTDSVPADLTSSLRMIQTETGEAILMIMIASPAAEAEVLAEIQPLADLGPVANTVGPTDPATFILQNGDPDEGPMVWIEHTLIDCLPVEAVEAAVEFADPAKGSPLMMSEIRHLGGALSVPAAEGGAQDRLLGNFCFMAMAAPEARRSVSHAVDVLSDFGTGRSYLNFALESQDRKAFFGPATIDRLKKVYDRLDPEAFFVQPHPF